MKLIPDRSAIQTWIFPTNFKKRDYQFSISHACLFDNTIVALPTGMGKTFIAGVVMLNCESTNVRASHCCTDFRSDYRWFPKGKVVFVAPTKPLVHQQIEACHQACGIPWHDAIELTGETKAQERVEFVRGVYLHNNISRSDTGRSGNQSASFT